MVWYHDMNLNGKEQEINDEEVCRMHADEDLSFHISYQHDHRCLHEKGDHLSPYQSELLGSATWFTYLNVSKVAVVTCKKIKKLSLFSFLPASFSTCI